MFSSMRWLKQTAMSPSAMTALDRTIGSSERSRIVIRRGRFFSQYSAETHISFARHNVADAWRFRSLYAALLEQISVTRGPKLDRSDEGPKSNSLSRM